MKFKNDPLEIQFHRKKPFLLAFASFLIFLHNLGEIWGLGMSQPLFAWGATPGYDRSFAKSEKPPRRRRWTPMSGPIPRAPRAARSGAGPRTARPNPAASVPRQGSAPPCIDAPGFGRLSNSLSEGFNDKAKTLKKAVAAYPTSSASGSGYPSSSAKATPGNEGNSKNKQAPGKVGEPQNLMGMNGNSQNRHPKAPNSMGMGNGQQNSGCFLFL